METKLKNKYEVGDKVYVTYDGLPNTLLRDGVPLTIEGISYDYIYPVYYFVERRGYALKEEHLTAFDDVIPKLEKHIEDCKTKLEELKHAQVENDN